MEPQPAPLRVVGAAIVDEGRLLLVSKQAAPDVFYLPGGKMVSSNGDLVGHAAAIARAAGRTPATPAEAKQILGLA